MCSPGLTLGWLWLLYVLDMFFPLLGLVVGLFFILMCGTVDNNVSTVGMSELNLWGLIHPSRVPG